MRIAVLFLLSVVMPLTALSATQPIYVNNAQVTSPPDAPPTIDATAFVNNAPFHVDSLFFSGLPFQTANTRYFTNSASGVMSGNPGYRFEYSSGNTRAPMYYWVNQGTISGDTFLLVSADNIISTGPLNSSELGLIRFTGANINLNRNGIRADVGGGSTTFSSSGGNLSDTNYIDPTGVSDLWWALGTNNVITGNGPLMPLNGGISPNFNLASNIFAAGPSTPTHRVLFPGSAMSSPWSFGVQNAAAYAYVSPLGTTGRVVQVIFVPTNSLPDTNISIRAFWTPDTDDGATAVVEFKYSEFDLVNQQYTTNLVYFSDSLAFKTNLSLAQNAVAVNTRRPNCYDLTRSSSLFGSPFFNEIQPNTPYSPALLYDTTFASNAVGVVYAACGAQFDAISVLNGSGQNVAGTTDPTNYPGRVEIVGGNVNLNLARIGAQSTVIIKATELASNKVAKIAAPYENLDLRTSQPEMVITNFAPPALQRLTGSLYAWSATWKNSERTATATNTLLFHVLMLQPYLNSTFQSVINELGLHAPRLVISDRLAAQKSMLLETHDLEVTGELIPPASAGWSNTNVVDVLNLTNRGTITVAGSAVVGADRATPYDNYVNIGTNTAASHNIQTRNFDNRGCLVASAGVVTVNATSASIAGPPLTTNSTFGLITNSFGFFTLGQVTNIVGAKIQSAGNIQITADQMSFSNALIQTGPSGALFLSPGSSLSDGGTNAISYWNVNAGFNLYTLPTRGNLFGTYVTSTTPINRESFHTWNGRDLGASNAGYSNNAALAKLTLDASTNSLIHFDSPPGLSGRALYVDYLELLNLATNVNTQLAIGSDFTIYFANANVSPQKLDGAADGHLRWVKSFAGPLSSTSYVYPGGKVYYFNTALVSDQDLDCDRDGIRNAADPTPIYTAESIDLQILPTKDAPGVVTIQWNAFPGVANTVQFCNSIVDPHWAVLRTVTPLGPYSGPYSITDDAGGTQRIYRVVVSVPAE